MPAPFTRLSPDGYGARRYAVGAFGSKTPDIPSAHPAGIITRVSLDGYGVRRYSSFAGKAPDTAPAITTGHHKPFIATPGRMMTLG